MIEKQKRARETEKYRTQWNNRKKNINENIPDEDKRENKEDNQLKNNRHTTQQNNIIERESKRKLF